MPHHIIAITHPLPEEGLEGLLKNHDLSIRINSCHKDLTCSELSSCAKGAEIIIPTIGDKVDDRVMDATGEQLRLIACYCVGYDNVDIEAATRRGIAVTNTPDVASHSVAEFAVAAMLAAAKKIIPADNYTKAGKYKRWDPASFWGMELRGKTLGIAGCGNIGSEMARICHKGFGMKILYYDINKNAPLEHTTGAYQVSLANLLESSDIISLHLPLTAKTKHIINAAALQKMKKTAIVINTARGAIVDESALATALKNGTIAAAALDVYEREPEISPELMKLPNIILSPHIASASEETRQKMGETVAQNILAVLKGEIPPNLVNEDVKEKFIAIIRKENK